MTVPWLRAGGAWLVGGLALRVLHSVGRQS
ncbi:hypothetical protein NBC2815_00621 [Xanthomonas fragariae]|nr:hypothetical protein NBC2815_00621 [Xanthomonas fragariae]